MCIRCHIWPCIRANGIRISLKYLCFHLISTSYVLFTNRVSNHRQIDCCSTSSSKSWRFHITVPLCDNSLVHYPHRQVLGNLQAQCWQYMCHIYIEPALTWWRHQMETLYALLAFVRGIHPAPVNSLHKGQWRGTLMFSLIGTWTNSWANNGDAGDLRPDRTHYDVIVAKSLIS